MSNNNHFCNECKMCCHKKQLNAVKKWISEKIYTGLHLFVIVALTTYILFNWKICISMRFFDEFDGNNVLFLTWIALIFLTIYRVEGNGVKIERRDFQQQVDEAEQLHRISQRRQAIDALQNLTSIDSKKGDK